MPWVRIDDEFPDHPKVVGAGPLGIAMQVAALCYCNRHLTDGFVPTSVARRLIDLDELKVDPDDIIAGLLRVGMWTRADGGYQIHNYGEYQPSRVEVEAEREKTRDRVAKHRANKRNKGRNASGNAVTNAPVMGAPVPKPVPPVGTEGSTVTDTSGLNTLVEQARPIDDTTDVFVTWQESTGKHGAKLDPKRRRKIETALKLFPARDVKDAVQGWVNSPHHCGQNDTGTVYNELTLLLRDAGQVEKFRDLWRDGPPAVMGKHTSQTVAFARQMATMRPAKEVTADDVGRVDGNRALAQRQLSRPEG